MVDFTNIPQELKQSCRFCVWKMEKDSGGRLTKVPYNPVTGGKAMTNNPSTFSEFAQAASAYAIGGYQGIGIRVSGVAAFDIDHCIREDGTLNDVATSVLSIFKSAYVEKSPSGTGLRGFFRVLPDYVYDKRTYYINNRKAGLEVYIPGATNRFVTVTGDVYRAGDEANGGAVPLDPEALSTLLETHMKRKSPAGPANHFDPQSYLDDDSVIEHASNSKNGKKFKDFYEGNWQKYFDNQSDADMSFLSALAFWCGCDTEQMDRIFRASGMMRPKWDRQQSGTTYGALSIQKAVDGCSSIYLPVDMKDITDPDEEFRDENDAIAETLGFQPDLSKVTMTLEEMQPQSNPRYGKEEIGIGNIFADYFKEIARYSSERKLWYIYDGTVWQPDQGNLRVAELAKLIADRLYNFALKIPEEDTRKRYIDRVKRLQMRKNRETMLKDANSVYPIAVEMFDRDIYLFNTENGTLDLRSGEFREHRAEDFITKKSPVHYDPDAVCPRWNQYMQEIFEGDNERVRYMQKALGYALSGESKMECLFILYGETTRNGKGTMMETVLKIMGDYGRTANPELLAMKFNNQSSSGPTEDLARLQGARFVNISEPEKKLLIGAALTKRLTGNDSITARFLHENSMEFKPVFKIFINCNHRPTITDLTLFTSGRIKTIPFNRHFDEEEQDKNLKEKFRDPYNMSGILNWMIEGFRLYQREGLDMPKSVLDATTDYQMDSDRYSQFIEQCVSKEKGQELRFQAVYNRYKDWCNEGGYHAEQRGNFKKRLAGDFVIEKRRPWNEKNSPATPMVNDVTWSKGEEPEVDDLVPVEDE